MRRPNHLKCFAPKSGQQGYSLFIVLMIMIVVALLVVTAVQSYNTEQRISTNDADRKLATSLAEAALRKGENKILEFDGKKIVFAANCKGKIGTTDTNGLCASPDAKSNGDIVVEATSGNAWEREESNKLYIDENSVRVTDIKVDNVSKEPRYIIEYISTDSAQGSTIYRVTAKAWGKNQNTVVMLQSYVSDE